MKRIKFCLLLVLTFGTSLTNSLGNFKGIKESVWHQKMGVISSGTSLRKEI